MAKTKRRTIVQRETQHLDEFIPQKQNANQHTQRGIALLDKSIRTDGWIGAITTAADGETFDGSARLETGVDIFGAEIQPLIVHSVGDRPIIVVRDDIPTATDPKAKRLGTGANVISKIDFNPDAAILAQLAAEDEAIYAQVMQDDELAKLLRGEAKSETVDAADLVDKAAELQTKWQVQRGDVWQIGRHKLMCGDSTSAEDVGKLMAGELANLVFTDPPYGVGYDGGTKVREKLAGDATTDLYAPCCAMAFQFSDDKSALYLWHAGIKGIAAAAAAAAAAAGYEIRCEIVWNKNQAQFGALSAQYKQKHEPCYYCYKRGKTVRWFGATNEVTVWDINRSSVNEFHPTQKPPELAVRAIGNNSERDAVVLDLFLGSASTLVACEQTGRQGRGLEIEPKYCAVALERLSLLGLTPERLPEIQA